MYDTLQTRAAARCTHHHQLSQVHSSRPRRTPAAPRRPPQPAAAPAPSSSGGARSPARARASGLGSGFWVTLLVFWASGTCQAHALPFSCRLLVALAAPCCDPRSRDARWRCEALLGERIWRLRRIFGGTWRGGGATRPCGRGAVGPALHATFQLRARFVSTTWQSLGQFLGL